MALWAISDFHLSFGVDKPMNIFGENWDGYEEKMVGGSSERGDACDRVSSGRDGTDAPGFVCGDRSRCSFIGFVCRTDRAGKRRGSGR